MKPVRKAVLPVAGLGTRFLPATKAVPKEMLPLVDKPLIEYAIDEARAAGIEEFIIVTGKNKPAIRAHFQSDSRLEEGLREAGKEELLAAVAPPKEDFSFVEQPGPFGLGHAIWWARYLVGDEPFAVLLPDDVIKGDQPCLSELLNVYEAHGGNVVALTEVPPESAHLYGIVQPGIRDGAVVEVTDIVEKPEPGSAPSNLGIVGRYILQPDVMDHLERDSRIPGDEIQLTDAIVANGGRNATRGVLISGTRFDCGTKLGYLMASVAFSLERKDLGDVEGGIRQILEAEGS
jgi:UTP-glucose-1-phosphate uridylyltransferase